jgi:hypothetical protein
MMSHPAEKGWIFPNAVVRGGSFRRMDAQTDIEEQRGHDEAMFCIAKAWGREVKNEEIRRSWRKRRLTRFNEFFNRSAAAFVLPPSCRPSLPFPYSLHRSVVFMLLVFS